MTDTETPPDDVAPPANVIAALARVQATIGGIEKRRGGEGGITYPFRGIDRIAAAAQPLLGRYGVVIVPELREQSIQDILVNNKPWTDTFVEVQWTLYGPGGVDDKIIAYTTGMGRDNSDKGINKAMTGAFKNLLLRVLCIGDPTDDTDGQTHERDNGNNGNNGHDVEPDENIELYNRVAATANTPVADTLKELAARHDRKLSAKAFAQDPDWREAVIVVLDAHADEKPPPEGVDGDTGEVLDVEQAARIDLLIDVLDSLEATDELATRVQHYADHRGKGLTRDALVADEAWANDVAAILLDESGGY